MKNTRRDVAAVRKESDRRKPEIMKTTRVAIVVLAVFVPAIANAQMNPIFSVLQSAQTAISQTRQLQPQTSGSNAASDVQQSKSERETQAQEDSARQAAAAQAQGQARMQQRMEEQRASDQRYGTGSAGYASDQAAIQASNQRDAERQQQAAAESRAMPDLCPNVNRNLTVGAFLVACKNAGATEQQLLARLGALPVMLQALYADIIQDIYDYHVVDLAKGDAIARYDATCTSQSNCQRRAW